MMTTKGRTVLIVAACTIAACLVAAYRMRNDPLRQAAKAQDVEPREQDIKDLVEEAVIYGFPLVMNYGVLYEHSMDTTSADYKAPFNAIHNEARVYTAADKSIVTPNSDTPYSTVMMDLRAEPVVLSVPAIPTSRYYSVMLCDGNAFNYGYIGSRATGGEAGDYLVAGPDWQGGRPAGIRKMFRSTTQFSLALFRTQLFGTDDLENVKKVQAQYKARTLSAYLGRPAPQPAPQVEFPKFRKALLMENFFDYLDFALRFAPAGPEEKDIRAKLQRLGLGAGQGLAFGELTLRHRFEVMEGMAKAAAKISQYAQEGPAPVNGWMNCAFFGNREFYNGDWLKRAAAVGGGIFGNDEVESVYYRATKLADGELLNGGKADYQLTFPAGSLPPVHSFWSVTLYNGLTFMLVDNPINRYLINSAMLSDMKKNADGSLTIYIQKDSPGPDKEANWLPARDGVFMLVMRLYWPHPEVLSGAWKPPALERVK